MTLTRIAVLFALTALTPLAAVAQQQQPPRPDLGKMARGLGVTETALKACMPAPSKSQRPQRPDPAKISRCLSNDNPKLTAARVGEVLKANGPQGKRGG
jgi:hypothetical protein